MLERTGTPVFIDGLYGKLVEGGMVLETVARIDGGIVLDLQSNLLAFGAILRHPDLTDVYPENIEGGRTTAAISAFLAFSVQRARELQLTETTTRR
jgi:hypothetical protein